MLLDAVRHGLALPIHEHVVGVVVGEHSVPVGVVPSGEVEVIHALEVAYDLIVWHEISSFRERCERLCAWSPGVGRTGAQAQR